MFQLKAERQRAWALKLLILIVTPQRLRIKPKLLVSSLFFSAPWAKNNLKSLIFTALSCVTIRHK